MKLKQFRIRNYKSIADSGVCSLASDLTILVGKNESGKTATLEALRDFDKSVSKISRDAFPLDGSNDEPSIEAFFHLDQNDLNKIQEDCGAHLADETISHILSKGLSIGKNCRGQYTLMDDSLNHLFGEKNEGDHQIQKGNIKTALERLSKHLEGHYAPDFDLNADNETIQKQSKELLRVIKPYLLTIKDEDVRNEIVETIRIIIKESNDLDSADQKTNLSFVEAVIKNLPSFIFFNEFSSVLPFTIPISNVKENQAVRDFAKIANLELDQVVDTKDLQKRINLLNRHSATISSDFLDYWGQNQVELNVRPEGENLLFGVKERDTTDFFKINQRSKGFQWFLSFYLRLNSQKEKNNIILIDEPGMNLHAKAQKEIIKFLENKIAPDTQVLFSTHCPYLIDTHRLDRLRLVTKDARNGTILSEDIERDADNESLMPLMTAMGAEKSSPQPASAKRNVLLNGYSVFYYLKALQRFMTNLKWEDISLIPSADSEDMAQTISHTIGHDKDLIVLLEHFVDGQGISEQLQEKFGLDDKKIQFVSNMGNYSIEDLFSRYDFNQHVLSENIKKDESLTNSQYLKTNHFNRVLLARKFYERAKQEENPIELSDETLTAFRKVFDNILIGFNGTTAKEKNENKEKTSEPVKRKSIFAFLSGK